MHHKDLKDGIIGLKNNSLYCFMNACLQCLLHMVVKLLVWKAVPEFLGESSETAGDTSPEFLVKKPPPE